MFEVPALKRAIAFVDGQNLFYAAREAFGYTSPNFDPSSLAASICVSRGWQLQTTHFYTGVPSVSDNPRWARFWAAKLAVMGTRGVKTFSRPLRYRLESLSLRDGGTVTALVGQEKGIDVRIALDVVRPAREGACDVALLFSQDEDLSEVADEVRAISREQRRWIKIACAFPLSRHSTNRRGINKTDWIPIERATYDRCLDPNNYLPKPFRPR